MNNIKRELISELVYTLKAHCKEENIPEKLRAAPDVGTIWNAKWADFEIYDIASELVDDTLRTLQKRTLETFIGGDNE